MFVLTLMLMMVAATPPSTSATNMTSLSGVGVGRLGRPPEHEVVESDGEAAGGDSTTFTKVRLMGRRPRHVATVATTALNFQAT